MLTDRRICQWAWENIEEAPNDKDYMLASLLVVLSATVCNGIFFGGSISKQV